MTKKVYLICPVNEVKPEEQVFLDDYVSKIESGGKKVHYPPRDVNQIDPIGTRILTEHRAAMREVDEVHAFLGQKTKGSYFDFGMAYMANLPLYIINRQEVLSRELDHFDKYALGRSINLKFERNFQIDQISEWAEERKREIKKLEVVPYSISSQEDLNKAFFFDLGMVFYSEKPIMLFNRDATSKLAVAGKKSFQNVLLDLDSNYKTK